jgi:hypothetical protein
MMSVVAACSGSSRVKYLYHVELPIKVQCEIIAFALQAHTMLKSIQLALLTAKSYALHVFLVHRRTRQRPSPAAHTVLLAHSPEAEAAIANS